MNKMNKFDFIRAYQKKNGVQFAQAREICESVLLCLSDSISQNESVIFKGLGEFKKNDRFDSVEFTHDANRTPVVAPVGACGDVVTKQTNLGLVSISKIDIPALAKAFENFCRTEYGRPMNISERICTHCGKVYKPTGTKQLFCSTDCRHRYYKINGSSRRSISLNIGNMKPAKTLTISL